MLEVLRVILELWHIQLLPRDVDCGLLFDPFLQVERDFVWIGCIKVIFNCLLLFLLILLRINNVYLHV